MNPESRKHRSTPVIEDQKKNSRKAQPNNHYLSSYSSARKSAGKPKQEKTRTKRFLQQQAESY
jgi:hypothetical protein